jgi:hypothetical protein
MLAKSKSGVTKLRRNRNKEAQRESAGVPGQPDRPAAERPPRTASNQLPPNGSIARPQRRLEPATEDQAMYSCECGFIFQATVSTSVGCPHCGGSQAW